MTLKSKNAYEQYLNQFYSDIATQDVAYTFAYLNNRSRGVKLSIRSLWNAIHLEKVGMMIKKYDSIRFNIGYNDWKNYL